MQAVVAFANAPAPRRTDDVADRFQHFIEQTNANLVSLKLDHEAELLQAAVEARLRRRLPTADEYQRLRREARGLLVGITFFEAKPTRSRRTASPQTRDVGGLDDFLRPLVDARLTRIRLLGGFRLRGLQLEPFSVPLLFLPEDCIHYALALLFSNRLGLRSKLRICPFVADPKNEPTSVSDDDNVHFFLDARGKRGQPMKYCSREHQNADFMRRARRQQRRRKSK